jgi:hypothetical protein
VSYNTRPCQRLFVKSPTRYSAGLKLIIPSSESLFTELVSRLVRRRPSTVDECWSQGGKKLRNQGEKQRKNKVPTALSSFKCKLFSSAPSQPLQKSVKVLAAERPYHSWCPLATMAEISHSASCPLAKGLEYLSASDRNTCPFCSIVTYSSFSASGRELRTPSTLKLSANCQVYSCSPPNTVIMPADAWVTGNSFWARATCLLSTRPFVWTLENHT